MTLITNLTLLQTLKLSPPHNHDDRNDHPFPPSPLPYHHQHCLDQRGSPGYSVTPSQGGSLASDLFHSDLEFRY